MALKKGKVAASGVGFHWNTLSTILRVFVLDFPPICLAGRFSSPAVIAYPHLSVSAIPIRARKPFYSMIYLILICAKHLDGRKRLITMINGTVPEFQTLPVLEKKNVYPVISSTWPCYREGRNTK